MRSLVLLWRIFIFKNVCLMTYLRCWHYMRHPHHIYCCMQQQLLHQHTVYRAYYRRYLVALDPNHCHWCRTMQLDPVCVCVRACERSMRMWEMERSKKNEENIKTTWWIHSIIPRRACKHSTDTPTTRYIYKNIKEGKKHSLSNVFCLCWWAQTSRIGSSRVESSLGGKKSSTKT